MGVHFLSVDIDSVSRDEIGAERRVERDDRAPRGELERYQFHGVDHG